MSDTSVLRADLVARDTATVDSFARVFSTEAIEAVAATDKYIGERVLLLGNLAGEAAGCAEMYLRSVHSMTGKELKNPVFPHFVDLLTALRMDLINAISPPNRDHLPTISEDTQTLKNMDPDELLQLFRYGFLPAFPKNINNIFFAKSPEEPRTEDDLTTARLRTGFVIGELILPVVHSSSELFQATMADSSPLADWYDQHALQYFGSNIQSSTPYESH